MRSLSSRWIKDREPPVDKLVCGMLPNREIKIIRKKKNGAIVTDGRKSHPVRIIAWNYLGGEKDGRSENNQRVERD